MWNKLTKLGRKFKAAIDFKSKKKKAKWDEFVEKNQARIHYLPVKNGRRVVPAIWNAKAEEWQWVTRQKRRHAANIVRRMR
jgi:hypothetical protein